jgi:hypothetical protein
MANRTQGAEDDAKGPSSSVIKKIEREEKARENPQDRLVWKREREKHILKDTHTHIHTLSMHTL